MIFCDECQVVVQKLNFCSDKCRVKHHRGKTEAKVVKKPVTESSHEATKEERLVVARAALSVASQYNMGSVEPEVKVDPYKKIGGTRYTCEACGENLPTAVAGDHWDNRHGDLGGA